MVGQHFYLAAYEKIKIIVKTKTTKKDSGVGITTKDPQRIHIINLFSHVISVYVRYICPYCTDISQARFK